MPSEHGDTFCIHPWTRLRLQSNGSAQVCCNYQSGGISDSGSPMSLERHSLADIWNSEEMRSVRRAMVDGRQVPGCRSCYADEAKGVVSMRIRDNEQFGGGFLNEAKQTIDQLRSLAVSHDFQLPVLPVSIEVDVGSLCNLKCRMCHGGSSSRIAADPVHSSWSADFYSGSAYHDESAASLQTAPRVFSITQKALEAALKESPGQIRRLYFIGGEPLIVRGVGDVLERLIETGDDKDTELAIVSNGSMTRSWLPLTKTFKRTDMAISIDGFDEHYDYIRYPAKWRNLAKSLAAFKEMAYVNLGASVTIQAYNALHITSLFRYLDSMEISFFAYPIHLPRHLTLDVMPPAARREAAKRLAEYVDRDCRPQHVAVIRGLIGQFNQTNDALDARLVRDFMRFTNDLDATRRQRVHDVNPELVSFLEAAGFPWSFETLHAPLAPSPKHGVKIHPTAEATPTPETPLPIRHESVKGLDLPKRITALEGLSKLVEVRWMLRKLSRLQTRDKAAEVNGIRQSV